MKSVYIDIQNVCNWLEKFGHQEIPCFMPPWDRAVYTFSPKAVKGSIEVNLRTDVIYEQDRGAKIREVTIPLDAYVVVTFEIKANGFHFVTMCHFVNKRGEETGKGGVFIDRSVLSRLFSAGFSQEKLIEDAKGMVFVVMFANALTHCKNVELIDQPLTRQQRRRKERKNEIYYKVLVIEPFKKQVRNEAAQHGGSEIDRALHICRGHFATYTEDKPLFGKYTGTFWKPMHVRGKRSAGMVVKDYEVHA